MNSTTPTSESTPNKKVRGDMNHFFFQNTESIDRAIGKELTQRFLGTWEWDKTNRCWISQGHSLNGERDVTLATRIRTWSETKSPPRNPFYPHLPIPGPCMCVTEVTVEVFANKMWGLRGVFQVDEFDVKDTQYYDESGHDSPIDGPIDNQ